MFIRKHTLHNLFRGKMGSSLHRSSKEQAIGGKPPYLMVDQWNLLFCFVNFLFDSRDMPKY